jgi:hypothetical protein
MGGYTSVLFTGVPWAGDSHGTLGNQYHLLVTLLLSKSQSFILLGVSLRYTAPMPVGSGSKNGLLGSDSGAQGLSSRRTSPIQDA